MKTARHIRHFTALLLALALLLTSCGGGARATTMHLKRTEGRVDVADDGGKDVEPRKNLGLYSGYEVDTKSDSYAWIDLDEVKLTKLDEKTEIEIQKDGEDLEIIVNEGSLFFNVTEPLADDETMTIRSSTMAVGIRGTCGWVELPDRDTMKVFLLEGKVRCEADGETETVRAGEMAIMTADGEITVSEFFAADVPAFVAEEVEDDDDLAEAILDDSGIDVTGGGGGTDASLKEYKSALDELKKEGKILYTEIVDFEADGNPELLVLHTREYRQDLKDEKGFVTSIFRKGSDGIDKLYFGGGIGDSGTYSLVEANGRMYLETFRSYKHDNGVIYFYSYGGSVAEKDGVVPSWNVGDWKVIIYSVDEYHNDGRTSYKVRVDFDGVGGGFGYEEARAIEILGKFNRVKVLAYAPGDGSLIISPDPAEVEEYLQPEAEPEQGQNTPPESDANSPLAPYVGTYTPYSTYDYYSHGNSITLDANGVITGGETNGRSPTSITENANGSISILFGNSERYTLFPVGCSATPDGSGYDSSQINIEYLYTGGGVMNIIYHADPSSVGN